MTQTMTTMSVKAVNKEIEEILHHDSTNNTLHGVVCLVCDKLMKRKERCKISLKTFLKSYAPHLKGDDDVPDQLRQCYKFSVPDDDEANRVLSECLLSPRAKVVHAREKRKGSAKVMCCQECKSGLAPRKLRKGELPRFAVANGMTIGTPPPCIERLNEIELALISQARFRGHLFTYWGGCHRSIKGWHSFYEVDPSHSTAVLGEVGRFTSGKNIAVVLCGPFTSEQKQKVLRRTESINTEWVMEAYDWLRANNRLYENVPIPNIQAPTIIDNSTNVESENTDIETKEEIRVVFPLTTVKAAGCATGAEFDKAVAEIKAKCGETMPYLVSRPSEKLLRDYEDENLMRAFPLQFPYGYGYHPDFNIKVSQNGCLKHLLSLSIPSFHEACSVLFL